MIFLRSQRQARVQAASLHHWTLASSSHLGTFLRRKMMENGLLNSFDVFWVQGCSRSSMTFCHGAGDAPFLLLPNSIHITLVASAMGAGSGEKTFWEGERPRHSWSAYEGRLSPASKGPIPKHQISKKICQQLGQTGTPGSPEHSRTCAGNSPGMGVPDSANLQLAVSQNLPPLPKTTPPKPGFMAEWTPGNHPPHLT